MTSQAQQRTEHRLERPLPSAEEAERCILGAVIMDNGFMAAIADRMDPGDFYSPKHRRIYTAMAAMFAERRLIEPIGIGEELKKDGSIESIGGVAAIMNLTLGLPIWNLDSVEQVLEYCRMVRDKRKLRDLVKVCSQVTANALDEEDNVSEILQFAQAAVNDLCAVSPDDLTAKSIADVFEHDVFPRIDQFVAGETVKIPFGFPQLDEATNGGAGLGELVLMGAKPKSGKSFLSMQIASYHALSAIPSLVVSREMANFENGFRLIAQRTKYSNAIFRPNLLSHTAEDMKVRAAEYFNLPLYLDDRSKTVRDIRRQARILKESVGLKTVFVDYAQLVRPSTVVKNQNRSEVLEAIYYDLKELAHDLQLVVYANTQFNRIGIKAQRPSMADFDGSSAAEKAGNLILIWDLDREWSELSDGRLGKLWIEAGRNVATDEFNIIFHGRHGIFSFSD